MWTDFYVTNSSAIACHDSVLFFQKTTIQAQSDAIDFARVENCQYRWYRKIRVFWDLSFRLVKASGNTTAFYHLKTTYTTQKKKYFLSKEGVISMRQSYSSGNQVIDFEQLKGHSFIAVQLYRGELLIGKQYFKENRLTFQIDTIIGIAQYGYKYKNETLPIDKTAIVLSVDFTSLKSIHLTLTGNKDTGNQLQIDAVKQW